MDKKIKIAFLSRYSDQVSRGVETHVEELSKRLGKDFVINVLSGDSADSFERILDGYNIVIPTNGRLQALKASLGRIKGGYKTILVGHAGIGRDDIWNIVVTKPDVYVALTDIQAKWASKWAWGSKIVKIPNGVDLEKFTPHGERVDLGLPSPVVLSVGALEWYKHHDLVIKAVALLNKGSLVIIGSGSLKDNLENMGNQLLGNDRFKIIQVDYEDIAKYYRSVDVFTLPSWNREAFGIVYLEAMASGLFVVAPDDLSRREIIGNAGILVSDNDDIKYAQSLERALGLKDRYLPRKQAEKFSWNIVEEQYKKLFKDLVNE